MLVLRTMILKRIFAVQQFFLGYLCKSLNNFSNGVFTMHFVIARADVHSSIRLLLLAYYQNEVVLTQLRVTDFLIHCIASIGVGSNSEASCRNLLPYLNFKIIWN